MKAMQQCMVVSFMATSSHKWFKLTAMVFSPTENVSDNLKRTHPAGRTHENVNFSLY